MEMVGHQGQTEGVDRSGAPVRYRPCRSDCRAPSRSHSLTLSLGRR
jgi:hypothetical protein